MDRIQIKIQSLIRVSLGLLCFVMGITKASGQGLRKFDTEVHLYVENDTVFTRQPVWATLRIKNGERPGPRIVLSELPKHFIIREKSGLILTLTTGDSRQDAARLAPRSVLEERLNIITPYYRLGKRDPYLIPGDYTAVFVWDEPGYGPLISDSVGITVRDPRGKESRALHLLNEGDRQFRLGDIQRSDGYYDRLVSRYPNSLYTVSALELKFRNHDRRMGAVHERIRMETAIKLIEEYSDQLFNVVRMFYELEAAVEVGSIPESLRGALVRWAEHPSERIRGSAARLLRKWDTIVR